MQKSKKIKAGELLLKLREAVIKLIEQVKELKNTTENLDQRLKRIEKKVVRLEAALSKAGSSATAPATPKTTSGSIEDLELEDLAKEIGIDLSPVKEEEAKVRSPESIPAPPAPPPIGELRSAPAKRTVEPPKPPPVNKPKKREMDLLPTEDLLGVKQAGEEDIEKEKDELLKALKELDEL